MSETIVTPDEAGQRLDRVLERLTPDMGLRGRRRLCAEGRVLVNGAPGREAYKVRPGDALLLVCGAAPEEPGGGGGRGGLSVRLVARGAHLAALDKPAGLHSEALAGKAADSVQARLPVLLPACPQPPRLLNRLDFPTSGLVLAALDREGEEQWRLAQDGGRTEKRYLALLEGELEGGRLLRQRLALKGRERVLVELAAHPDVRRHTRLMPLAVLPAEEVLAALAPEVKDLVWNSLGSAPDKITLAGCLILKGARHQIRAHAAAAGFPLLGDRRYGARWRCDNPAGPAESSVVPENERFFLHHGRVSVPGFTAWLVPAWLERLSGAAQAAGKAWLRPERPALADERTEEERRGGSGGEEREGFSSGKAG